MRYMHAYLQALTPTYPHATPPPKSASRSFELFLPLAPPVTHRTCNPCPAPRSPPNSLLRPKRTIASLYGPLTPATAQPPDAAAPLPHFSEWNEARRNSYRRRTVRDTWLCILCELQGFGPTSAQNVIRVFPTPRLLFDAYEAAMRAAKAAGRDAVAAARGVLRARAGLSATRSQQVFDELYANGWHVV